MGDASASLASLTPEKESFMARNSMAKERIDIERLLEWAYRVQCVDRQVTAFSPRGPSASPAGSLGQYAVLGTRVDNSSFAARAAGLRLPDDAMIIHDTVLSLGEMWIEWVGGDEVQIWDMDRAAREGQAIEKRGGIWYREPIYSSVPVRPLPVRLEQACTVALVIVNAKNGSQPEFHAGWWPSEGRPAAAGRDVDRPGRPKKDRGGVSFEAVMHARACYLVWHAALALLAVELEGALERFEVSGPVASPCPWQKPQGRRIEAVQLQNSTGHNALKRQVKK